MFSLIKLLFLPFRNLNILLVLMNCWRWRCIYRWGSIIFYLLLVHFCITRSEVSLTIMLPLYLLLIFFHNAFIGIKIIKSDITFLMNCIFLVIKSLYINNSDLPDLEFCRNWNRTEYRLLLFLTGTRTKKKTLTRTGTENKP